MYDAIVVGARCAGSPTAMLLARAGRRVLLVDRAELPQRHALDPLHPPVGRRVAGALGAAAADRRRRRARRSATTRSTSARSRSRHAAADRAVADAYSPAPHRARRDPRRGRRRGGRGGPRAGSRSTSCSSSRRPRHRHPLARAGTERARIVIGADGLNSLVARQVGAPAYDDHGTLTCAYYTYWSGVPMDGVELYLRDGERDRGRADQRRRRS